MNLDVWTSTLIHKNNQVTAGEALQVDIEAVDDFNNTVTSVDAAFDIVVVADNQEVSRSPLVFAAGQKATSLTLTLASEHTIQVTFPADPSAPGAQALVQVNAGKTNAVFPHL